jgi:hypothetical protein
MTVCRRASLSRKPVNTATAFTSNPYHRRATPLVIESLA